MTVSDHVVVLKIVTLPPLPPDRSEDCICCAVNRRCKAKREVQAKWSNDLFLDALLCRWRVLPSYKKIDLGCIRLHPEYLLHKNCIHACTSHLYVCICKSKHKINSTTTQCKLHLATPSINSLQERRHITYSSQESQLSRWWGALSLKYATMRSSPRPCYRTRIIDHVRLIIDLSPSWPLLFSLSARVLILLHWQDVAYRSSYMHPGWTGSNFSNFHDPRWRS